jgi:hypothetical protein
MTTDCAICDEKTYDKVYEKTKNMFETLLNEGEQHFEKLKVNMKSVEKKTHKNI